MFFGDFGPHRRRFVDNGLLRRYFDLSFRYEFVAQNCLVLAQKILKKMCVFFFVILVTFQAKWRRFIVLDITTAPIHLLGIFVIISIYVSQINIKNRKNIILRHKGHLWPNGAANGVVSYGFLNTAILIPILILIDIDID